MKSISTTVKLALFVGSITLHPFLFNAILQPNIAEASAPMALPEPQVVPSPLCMVEFKSWCCHQVGSEWIIADCGGGVCEGASTANHVIHYDRTFGSPGYSHEQWETQEDGSTCTYNQVECIAGYCVIDSEKITWHCHKVILSESCK